MAKKYITLSSEQKDEIRRLTQFANRRIRSAEKQYKKEGLEILPTEVVGKYQIKSRWVSEKTPISRSVKFETEAEYRKQLEFLRSFEYKRPTIHEYADLRKSATKSAIEGVAGYISPDLNKKIDKMNAPQLAIFWSDFEDRANKMGIQYSSSAVLEMMTKEYFDEDINSLMS